jgi:uncharacterized pyridoxamine 5'-phosphate oxidase family protein
MSSVVNSTLPVKIAFFDIDGTLLPLGVREPSAKIVYTLKELQRNGVILCMATGRGVLAVVGGEFMRYDGLAKVVKDDALLAKVREIMPQIMDMYDKNGWEMGLFYLENGHAEIRGMLDLKEEFDV